MTPGGPPSLNEQYLEGLHRYDRGAVRRKHEPELRAQSELVTSGVDERVADRERLRVALAQLPASQRAIVILRVLEDLSVRDTAHELGVSEGTVKAQLSRALERLKASLDLRDEP